MHPIDWITGSIIDSAMRIHFTDCRAALLINFNEPLLKQGIKRIVN